MLAYGLSVLGFVVIVTVMIVDRQQARRSQRQLVDGPDGHAPARRGTRWWDGGWSEGWGTDLGGGGGGDCGGGGGGGDGGGGGC